MLLTLLSALGGMAVNVIPAVISYLIRRQQTTELKAKYEHEYKLAELELQYKEKIGELNAGVQERQSIRSSDSSSNNSSFVGFVRASVRPVITYTLFAMFVIIKGYSFLWAVELGYDAIMAVQLIWDEPTHAIFSAIIGFWFGSRVIERVSKDGK